MPNFSFVFYKFIQHFEFLMGFWPPDGFKAILCPKIGLAYLIFMIMGLVDSSNCFFGQLSYLLGQKMIFLKKKPQKHIQNTS